MSQLVTHYDLALALAHARLRAWIEIAGRLPEHVCRPPRLRAAVVVAALYLLDRSPLALSVDVRDGSVYLVPDMRSIEITDAVGVHG